MRPWVTSLVEYDLAIGFYYDDENDMDAKNVVVEYNIASSSPHFAFAVPGHSCSKDSYNFKYNTGHSSKGGWFSLLFDKNCQKHTNFRAFKNSE